MFKPNTHYYAWLPYRNAPDNQSGEAIGDGILTPDKPKDIDGTHWAKIGAFVTNNDGNIHFFDHAG